LVERLISETRFLKSFQYSAVAGNKELCARVIGDFIASRSLKKSIIDELEIVAMISNGAKHGLNNVLGSLINRNDEVIVIT
jgi:aspartate/methionine/tyrosine aminotransferase